MRAKLTRNNRYEIDTISILRPQDTSIKPTVSRDTICDTAPEDEEGFFTPHLVVSYRSFSLGRYAIRRSVTQSSKIAKKPSQNDAAMRIDMQFHLHKEVSRRLRTFKNA